MTDDKHAPLSKEEWDELKSNRAARKKLTAKSLYWFFHLYFEHYIEYETAPFQKELIAKVSDSSISQLAVMAFRDSGKSSILTTAYPLWSIVGEQQKKFILIVSLNQALANNHLRNIAKALEDSKLLRDDFWPYDFEENETSQSSIKLPKFNAEILAVGREQGFRGIRQGQHRPDVIIADDIEDTSNTKYQHSRDKNFQWYSTELMTLGNEKTKYITIGNMVHYDAVIARLKYDMENNLRDGVFLEYPLVKNGVALWKARYPDKAAIKALERRIGNPTVFQREYMLKYVSDEKSPIKREDICYYDKLEPLPRGAKERIIVGVDPAIAQTERADSTAMIIITARGYGDDTIYYIHPNPVNRKMTITELHDQLNSINQLYGFPKFYIESNAFQLSVGQAAQQRGLNIANVPSANSKMDRLIAVAHKLRSGKILFPRKGAENIINQIIDFPAVEHDDLVDALTIPITQDAAENMTKPGGRIWYGNGPHIVDAQLRRRRMKDDDPYGWW